MRTVRAACCSPARIGAVTCRRCWPWPTPRRRDLTCGSPQAGHGDRSRGAPSCRHAGTRCAPRQGRLPAAGSAPRSACPARSGERCRRPRRDPALPVRSRRRLRRLRLDPGLSRRARRRGIPIVIHEQNARPGLANRLGPGSRPVATTSRRPSCRTRASSACRCAPRIAQLDRRPCAPRPGRTSGSTDAPTLLVTGGSLAAQRLNEAGAAAAPSSPTGRRCSICRGRQGVRALRGGGRGRARVRRRVRGLSRVLLRSSGVRYVVLPYVERMELALRRRRSRRRALGRQHRA